MHTRIRTDTAGMHKKVSKHTPFICSKAFTRSTGSTLSSDKFGSWKGNKIYHFIIHNYINNKKSRKLITLPISREAELLSSPELISYSSSLWPFADLSSEGQLDIIHYYKTKNNKGQSYNVWKKKMQAHWMTPLQPHCNNEMQVKKIVQLKKIMKDYWSNNIFTIKFIPVHILLNTKRQTQTNWNIEMNAQWRTLLLGDQREQADAMSSYSQF